MSKTTAKPKSNETEGSSSSAMSKTDAVRTSIRDGVEAPLAAVAYIKKSFGIDITPQHFSAVKSMLRKKARESGKAKGGKSKSSIEGFFAPPSNKSGKHGGDILQAMEAMKPLVATYGVEKVKRLAELLG